MTLPETALKTWPTPRDIWKAKSDTAQAILRFPGRCPMCGADQRGAEYEHTLGHRMTYWCGMRMDDNAGRINGGGCQGGRR